jgi:ferrous iron transport protein B
MATRTIESERERKVTIMILPLMSCGARLPIYALIIPAFFAQKYQATVMWIIYLIGVIVALIAAKVLKSTLFKGEGEIYLMELPPYRMPTLKSLMLHMWDRGRMYLQKAGTIILFTSILLYVCNTFPVKKEFSKNYEREIAKIEQSLNMTKEAKEESISTLENESRNAKTNIAAHITNLLTVLFFK